jgi:ribonuclease Z
MAPEWEQGHRRNGRFYFQWQKAGGGLRWGTKGLAGEDPVSWISRAPIVNLEASRDFGEIGGGTDIYPRYDHPKCADGAPIWEVINDGDVTVKAAPMSHGVPCVGYVIHEKDSPGRLQPENVLPVIERNRESLKEAGVKNPMKVMAMIKSLPVGGSYTFPDGTVLKQEDVVEPPRAGRKIVICGDTADCRALESLAWGADVLIHEATNTFLSGVDKDGNLRMVTRDAKIHGHSTPIMAGEFAKKINAKKLVLNHFSARYKGDQSLDSITIMTRMERQAIKSSGMSEDAVACAWDFMLLPVSRN